VTGWFLLDSEEGAVAYSSSTPKALSISIWVTPYPAALLKEQSPNSDAST